MSELVDVEQEPFRVAVVGPSRVGKTTLLTAILSETERQLAGTGVRILAGETTEERIHQQRRALRRAIAAEEFDAAALSGNQTTSLYEVVLRADSEPGVAPQDRIDIEIPFSILDYPGGWLNPVTRNRSAEAQQQWPACEDHIQRSVMLLVPIDAAVLMEARKPAERGSVVDLLGIEEVTAMTRLWARSRKDSGSEPAVLVLAPLKCEKYFDDNGGGGKEAPRLRQLVQDTYRDAVEAAEAEAPGRVKVVYAPIDTYGCVELMEPIWHDVGGEYLEFTGHYRFRGRPPRIQEKAAATVMRELCRSVISAQAARNTELARAATEEQRRIFERRYLRKGFFGALTFYLSGEAWWARRDGILTAKQLIAAKQSERKLNSALRSLSTEADDPRVEVWQLR
ncbi:MULTISPECIES: ATP-binding protein [Streptacidiphilus]|uniref:ATP-binding protein n=2 Tax=Streptacidiphilus TaxID=228398 RepID=A0ABV6UUP6_9ACTN|nr:ATP-binding protein [Streptacidiphilus jeojiense]